eukprot:CAMPEP_0198149056 /NCGR_PEP_ID=MMETSP1443-20131203/44819_1 /TAXON_ID=186043 /ORGANISM="Entomoneis sp., Strain CCMP2396" /LENGTH=152 /DNA_ID=CAMNT_0043813967 /DNA_START=294 /DNA_END=749 /DNA_ORIENTATION=-
MTSLRYAIRLNCAGQSLRSGFSRRAFVHAIKSPESSQSLSVHVQQSVALQTYQLSFSRNSSTTTDGVYVEESKNTIDPVQKQTTEGDSAKGEIKAACGTLPNDDDDDEEEQEEMFVDPYESFNTSTKEWGGPRRGGRLPEPTRYGDWERKGR